MTKSSKKSLEQATRFVDRALNQIVELKPSHIKMRKNNDVSDFDQLKRILFLDREFAAFDFSIEYYGWGNDVRGRYDVKLGSEITWSSTERTIAQATTAVSYYRDMIEFLGRVECIMDDLRSYVDFSLPSPEDVEEAKQETSTL